MSSTLSLDNYLSLVVMDPWVLFWWQSHYLLSLIQRCTFCICGTLYHFPNSDCLWASFSRNFLLFVLFANCLLTLYSRWIFYLHPKPFSFCIDHAFISWPSPFTICTIYQHFLSSCSFSSPGLLHVHLCTCIPCPESTSSLEAHSDSSPIQVLHSSYSWPTLETLPLGRGTFWVLRHTSAYSWCQNHCLN